MHSHIHIRREARFEGDHAYSGPRRNLDRCANYLEYRQDAVRITATGYRDILGTDWNCRDIPGTNHIRGTSPDMSQVKRAREENFVRPKMIQG
eukprot:196108-Amorphochlora_amoeboformis.AAC.1